MCTVQALTGSGLAYAILRTGKPDLDKEGSELGQLALGPQGSRPQQSAISPDQARVADSSELSRLVPYTAAKTPGCVSVCWG